VAQRGVVVVTALELVQRPAGPEGVGRLELLDKLRGLAIVLMVVDHVAVQTGSPWFVRTLVTRPALPLFLLVAGMLWRPGLRRRHLQLAAAAGSATVLGAQLGMVAPDVLVVIGIGLAAMPLAVRWPVVTLALAAIQPTTWPLWQGYEPGTVLVLLYLGHALATRTPLELRWADRLPWWTAVVGRFPLTVYVGHLAVLALMFGVR
jgi:hypothetical protein